MKWVGYVAYMDNAFCGTVLTLKCGVFTLAPSIFFQAVVKLLVWTFIHSNMFCSNS